MQIQEPTKVPTVTEQILCLEVGAKLYAPISKRKYIGSLISGGLKYQYPDRVWTTKIDSKNNQLVIIERTK